MSPTQYPRLLFLWSRLFQAKLGTLLRYVFRPLIGKKTHKQIHKQHQTYDPFINVKGFKYTGTLRACYPEIPVARRAIPSHIVLPDHAETGIPYAERKARSSHSIDILTPAEIQGMKKVCKVSLPFCLCFQLIKIVGERGIRYHCSSITVWNHDAGVRPNMPWSLCRTRFISFTVELRKFPKEHMHFYQWSYLSWNPRHAPIKSISSEVRGLMIGRRHHQFRCFFVSWSTPCRS